MIEIGVGIDQLIIGKRNAVVSELSFPRRRKVMGRKVTSISH